MKKNSSRGRAFYSDFISLHYPNHGARSTPMEIKSFILHTLSLFQLVWPVCLRYSWLCKYMPQRRKLMIMDKLRWKRCHLSLRAIEILIRGCYVEDHIYSNTSCIVLVWILVMSLFWNKHQQRKHQPFYSLVPIR